jgi:hypothetical protein
MTGLPASTCPPVSSTPTPTPSNHPPPPTPSWALRSHATQRSRPQQHLNLDSGESTLQQRLGSQVLISPSQPRTDPFLTINLETNRPIDEAWVENGGLKRFGAGSPSKGAAL